MAKNIKKCYHNNMDTFAPAISTTAIAARLGVSLPTIHRAIARLKLEPHRGAKGHLCLSEEDARILLEHLGKAPKVDGFTREELFVLKVLQERPFGLRSVRAVARYTGISPTTASDALRKLEQRGIIEHRCVTVAEGRARQIQVWILRIDPYWMRDNFVALIRSVVVPAQTRPLRREMFVPRRFKHLFWNADLSKLNTTDHGPAIAISIIEQYDPHALAWAIKNLDKEAFAVAARQRRGLSPEMLALASHIAERA
ncbi:MAG: MarR family transcriptional regulator [Actinomycetota bacterium]|nr:MarR family transcriptional regulator [Actinomycetota bacterium]